MFFVVNLEIKSQGQYDLPAAHAKFYVNLRATIQWMLTVY